MQIKVPFGVVNLPACKRNFMCRDTNLHVKISAFIACQTEKNMHKVWKQTNSICVHEVIK